MNKLLALEVELFKDRNFDFITERDGKSFPKQAEALSILTDTESTELTYGGASAGAKSHTGSVWLLFSALAHPGTKWFIGREELKRLRDTTLLTLFEVMRLHGVKPSEDYKYNGQDNYFLFTNGSRIDLLDLRFMPRDPLYERYGSSFYTGGWLEECGEVNFGAYDVLKGRVGKWKNDKYNLIRKLLKTCNPKKNWLYTEEYKPFRKGTLPPEKKFLQAFVEDNPYNDSGVIDALRSMKDKAKKERLLYGNWEYDDDPAKLMEYDAITDLFTNNANGQGTFITADIARFGDDATVIMAWHGWKIVDISAYERTSIPASVSLIEDIAQKYSVPRSKIVVDEDGLGGGVKDLLRCKGFISNSKPAKVKFDVENYDNLKSQCYYKLAEKVNDREISIDCQNTEMIEMITEELEVVKQKDVDNDKKKGIIPKSKIKELIGRSPDYSDAIMMRLYFELFKSGRASSV